MLMTVLVRNSTMSAKMSNRGDFFVMVVRVALRKIDINKICIALVFGYFPKLEHNIAYGKYLF